MFTKDSRVRCIVVTVNDANGQVRAARWCSHRTADSKHRSPTAAGSYLEVPFLLLVLVSAVYLMAVLRFL